MAVGSLNRAWVFALRGQVETRSLIQAYDQFSCKISSTQILLEAAISNLFPKINLTGDESCTKRMSSYPFEYCKFLFL